MIFEDFYKQGLKIMHFDEKMNEISPENQTRYQLSMIFANFLSWTGSGFQGPGGTPQPQLELSTPPGHLENLVLL